MPIIGGYNLDCSLARSQESYTSTLTYKNILKEFWRETDPAPHEEIFMRDEFFNKKQCDRCEGDLRIRRLGFFNEDVICARCIEDENEVKRNLEDYSRFEGCGYIPSPGQRRPIRKP